MTRSGKNDEFVFGMLIVGVFTIDDIQSFETAKKIKMPQSIQVAMTSYVSTMSILNSKLPKVLVHLVLDYLE